MALIRCEFFSEVLELSTSMTVLLPQATQTQIGMQGQLRGGDPPVLYLLHGLSDDDTIWLRRTSIERFAAPLGLAVVMPQVHRSFYCDQVHGGRYWTFLSEELPQVVADFFRVSQRREDTFVAGLSMGGYGAFKWALRQPGRFAAAASLSGALDLARLQHEGGRPAVMAATFGDRAVAGSDDDLFRLLAEADPATLPPLYLGCGSEDQLIGDNRRFAAAAADHGVALTSEIAPGEHEWGFWDAGIRNVLEWLPLRP
jgi:S-formylglutathione hydrolase FrmB